MDLLVAVVNHEDRIEEILRSFLEIGISGATVIDSHGMGRLLGGEMPDFAKLQTLVAGTRPRNQTLFSVIEDPAKTVPLNRVVGLAPSLLREEI